MAQLGGYSREPDTGVLQGGTMQTRVAYGDTGLWLDVPDDSTIVTRATARLRRTSGRPSATALRRRSPGRRCGSG